MLDRQRTVASLVLDHTACAQVFQRHRIDFCCHGDVSVAAAAAARGLDVERLLAELEAAIRERRVDPDDDPRALPTPELIARIVGRHHEFLRRVLPFVAALATKVSRVHGGRNAKLRELEACVHELAELLLAHLDGEEARLFPALLAGPPARGGADPLLADMVAEHHAVAELLERVRAAADDFAPPEWACRSYHALFGELRQLESDVFTHVHLEQHVLLPRFVAA